MGCHQLLVQVTKLINNTSFFEVGNILYQQMLVDLTDLSVGKSIYHLVHIEEKQYASMGNNNLIV